ncbi:RloB family protein [Micromonospora cathayae]|uniref:RloB family protein n=1 Tax=Micromonospora cathayae TaxID=3028804 RepID=A0ABY7ZST2_9ACTN|nr:RloB family protein [Micromonospora sp. HUAS 3]WDZ86057.1 RloB family protein [Micromonospora sp. HUAS 3]
MVFCEGEASEPDYVNALKRLPEVRDNTAVSIEIDPQQGAPITLVQRAVVRSQDDEVDECWCVFDVEWPQNHPRLMEAVRLASAHGIRLAISNPCFELWLTLHFTEQTAFLTSADAERQSRGLDGRIGKRIDGPRYVELRREATRRAIGLSRRHAGNQTPFPENNPSSTMYELIAAIEPAPASR